MDPAPGRRRTDPARARTTTTRRRWRRWLVLLVLVTVTGGAVGVLAHSQAEGRQELADRFVTRGALSADVVSRFAAQLLDREATVAAATLTTDAPQQPFDSLVAAFGFQSALLLDAQGRVLAVSPASPSLLGTEVASRYPHLSSAVTGRRAISPVVLSAAEQQPVVGFAAPYDTAGGVRVLSGAFRVSDTPLTSYLTAFSSLRGYRAVIVDGSGGVVATTRGAAGGRLSELAPELVGTVPGDPHVVGSAAGPLFVAAHDVEGTPWQLLTAVPEATLLEPVTGPSRVLPWVILGAFVAVAALTYALGLRLVDGRRRLQAAHDRLDALANVDPLTGVANRRRTGDVLRAEADRCAREESPLSVLLVDVDHFKRVNDTFGHASGDAVLVEVAVRMAGALRTGDTIGRWGGEEFLVVLPEADATEATAVAERLRAVVAEAPVPVGTGGDEITVTTSTGLATSRHPDGTEALVALADRALYAAKAAGRNLVRSAGR